MYVNRAAFFELFWKGNYSYYDGRRKWTVVGVNVSTTDEKMKAHIQKNIPAIQEQKLLFQWDSPQNEERLYSSIVIPLTAVREMQIHLFLLHSDSSETRNIPVNFERIPLVASVSYKILIENTNNQFVTTLTEDHEVEIGEHNVIAAAQSGFAGSAKTGKYGMPGGQVGIGGHVVLYDQVIEKSAK